jgi:hypothetical protein
MSRSLAAVSCRERVATCIALATFLLAPASYGQPPQATIAGAALAADGQPNPAPVHPETLPCDALKAQLKSAGELNILSGPRGGWGDTFYGPAVPRCEFWQMPVFTYVRASDRRCGVGYICVEKYSVD